MYKHLILLLWLTAVSCRFPLKTDQPSNLSEIIFKEVSILEDSSQYLASLGEAKASFKESLAEAIKRESNALSENVIDSLVELQMKLVPFVFEYTNSDTLYYITKYRDSVVLSYQAINSVSNVRGDYMIISPAKKIAQFLAKKDSNTIYREIPFESFRKEKLTIEEHPTVTRNIAGYECFKVITTRTDSLEGWLVNQQQIMYVTKRIKNRYHPLIRSEEILTKYFPLEIKKEHIRGTYKHYSLERIEFD